MTDPIFGLAVNIFLMIIALWSVSEVIINRTNLGITSRKFTRKGAVLITSAIAVVLFSFIKDLKHDRDLRSDKVFQEKKDSKNKEDVVDAVTKNTNEIAAVLAKDNLRLQKKSDSLYSIIKDSPRQIINAVPTPLDPTYTLCIYTSLQDQKGIIFKKINDGLDSLYTNYCVYNNDIAHLTQYIFILVPRLTDTLITAIPIERDASILKGLTNTSNTEIPGNFHIAPILYIKMLATYTNGDGRKKYAMDETYTYDVGKNTYMISSISIRDALIQLLIQKNPVAKKYYTKHKLE